jgi:hypothetical protein
LARLDPGGMAFFDTSVGGVWRSFFAAVIIAPLYALLLSIRLPLEGAGSEIDPLQFWLTEGTAYVVSWVAYPVIMITVTQLLNRSDRFQEYVVAYNWSMVLQNALILPIGILSASGVISTDAGGFLWLVALVLILIYMWFIARTALALPPFAAAGIVALDIALSFLISGVARGMY